MNTCRICRELRAALAAAEKERDELRVAVAELEQQLAEIRKGFAGEGDPAWRETWESKR